MLKRLIEVSSPLNEGSARKMSIRHGKIAALHICTRQNETT